VFIISEDLELVTSAKILGLTIRDDFKWHDHVENIVKKANERLFSIIQLKRANIPALDIVSFYKSCGTPESGI
jgi:hypothetical protein